MSGSPKAICGQTSATLPDSIPGTLYPKSVEPLAGAPCAKL